jgi:hypothetical protein
MFKFQSFEKNYFANFWCCYTCFPVLYSTEEKLKSNMDTFTTKNQRFRRFVIGVCLEVCLLLKEVWTHIVKWDKKCHLCVWSLDISWG